MWSGKILWGASGLPVTDGSGRLVRSFAPTCPVPYLVGISVEVAFPSSVALYNPLSPQKVTGVFGFAGGATKTQDATVYMGKCSWLFGFAGSYLVPYETFDGRLYRVSGNGRESGNQYAVLRMPFACASLTPVWNESCPYTGDLAVTVTTSFEAAGWDTLCSCADVVKETTCFRNIIPGPSSTVAVLSRDSYNNWIFGGGSDCPSVRAR